MDRRIVVAEATGVWIEDRQVEIVERKGIGHPDSLCDGIAERISVEYTRWCQENVGTPLHHNFDKVQLVAGRVDVDFGGGWMLAPIRIQIAGRGTSETPDGHTIPMSIIAIEAAKSYLRERMRHLNPERHCVIDCYAGSGAGELMRTVERVTANDSSVGVAHWPLSMLEQIVKEITRFLNEDLVGQFPIGEDVKVMGARIDGEIVLTCAVPFIASRVSSLAHYQEAKRTLRQAIEAQASSLTARRVQVNVNMADDEAAESVYLTLTGTSAENGDDGATGRGNRVSGLITPFRHVSLEAAAGKNPVSHVGKLYNVVALLAAKEIVARVPAVRQAQVFLLSQIGRPVDDPLVAAVDVHPAAGPLSAAQRQHVQAILAEHLADVDRARQMILDEEISVF